MSSRRDYDYLFKLVLIGDSCVGKSCLLIRFADDDFTENYVTTIGVDFRFRTMTLLNKAVKLQIWDTAGQERYRTITNAYYRGADGIIMVFDISNRESFLHLRDWLKEVEKNAPESTQLMVFGNKSDLNAEREVSQSDLEKFTKETGIPVIETSAKNSSNVEKGFVSLTSKLIEKKMDEGDEGENNEKGQVTRLNDKFFNPEFEAVSLRDLHSEKKKGVCC